MGFRRSGSSDQRRRRVLLEEQQQVHESAGAGSGAWGDTSAGPRRRRRYAEAATADPQAPMTAVIPQRVATLLVLGLAGLCVIVGVQAIYVYVGLRASQPGWEALQGWDVTKAGSLAGWFCSMLLLAAGFQGVQVYRLRQHREDDYQGRYRLWLWVAPAVWFLALAAGTQLPQGLVRAVLHHWLAGDHWLSAAVPAFLPAALWLVLALRLVFELRESRLALTALASATLLLPGAAVIPVLFTPHPVILTLPMLASSLTMLGHLAVFLTVASYARHVYRDAHGQLTPPALATAEKPAAQAASAPPAAERPVPESERPVPQPETSTDSNHPASAALPPAEREAEQAETTAAKAPEGDQIGDFAAEAEQANDRSEKAGRGEPTSDQETPDQETPDRPLSKAARRRLRKMQRREQGRQAA